MLEVSLEVTNSIFRTWSHKLISKGKWSVEVLDEAGELLAVGSFFVVE